MDLFSQGIIEDDFEFEPKPWMKCVNMVLVTNETLHDCIEHCINAPVDPLTGNKYYSLDLETTGLDTRVFNGATKDMIVGVCLSPDGRTGYYIPVRHIGSDDQPSPHNVSYTLFKREFMRLVNSDAIAIFHNGKFDLEFLEFTGEEPFGNWDDPKSWEDTLILDYLRDNRARQHGLKFLSGDRLKITQLKLNELFPKGRVPKNKNFALLDPSRPGILEYAAGDAICTYLLYFNIRDETLILPSKYSSGKGHTQIMIYHIEKLCCTATRWMERNRIKTDRKKVAELIQLGQKDYIESLTDIYQSASQILGRDIAPLAFYLLLDDIQKKNPDLEAYHTEDERSLKCMQDEAKKRAKYIQTVCQKGGVAMLGIEQRYLDLAQRPAPNNYESEYDVSSQQQLGILFKELNVPDLEVTEGSGQIKTSIDFLEAAADKHGKEFPFLLKIKRFREVQKALSTYLYALFEDACEFMVCNDCNRSFTGSGPCSCGSHDIERDNSIKIDFRAWRTDTGRFSCPQGKDPSLDGVARFPLQGTPAGYDSSRPKCMQRMRECFIARKGKFLFACVAEGSLISTPRGLVPIENIVAGQTVSNDAGGGPVVWAGQTGQKETICVSTSKGFELCVTPEHKMLIISSVGDFEWKQAQNLTKGDWLVLPGDNLESFDDPLLPKFELKISSKETPICVPKKLTPRLAEFLGRFMGDGCIGHYHGKKRYVGLSLGCDQQELHPKIAKFLQETFGLENFKKKPKGDSHCWSQPFARWVDFLTEKGSLGVNHYHVPDIIMCAPRNHVCAFLRGLFDADGTVGKRSGDGVSLWVTSDRMAKEVQLLLLSVGVLCRRESVTRKTNFGTNHGNSITIFGLQNLERFYQQIGFSTNRKQSRLDFLTRESRNRDMSVYVPYSLAKKIVPKQRFLESNRLHSNGRRKDRVSFYALSLCADNCPEDVDFEQLALLKKGVFFDTVETIQQDRVRTVFDLSVPDAGQRFVANGITVHNCDFSGVELRLVTNLSGEPKWLREYFRCSDCSTEFSRGDGKSTPEAPPPFCPTCGSDKIGDIHTLTGLTINGPDAKEKNPPKIWKKMRKDAKGVNFGLCYGGGPAAVVRATSCSYEKAKSVKRTFDDTYNTLFSWWETERKFARKYGYVRTAFGRKCPLPDIYHEDRGFRAKAERNATNAPIQGSSADITKLAMGLIYKEVKNRGWFGKVNMLITMHDELVFEIDFDIAEEAADVIMHIMTRNSIILGRKWAVPLTVDCEMGYDWTVPWNLTEFRYGKEPWPEDLKPYFTKHLRKKVSEGAVEGKSVYYFTVPYLSDSAIETIACALCESRGGQDHVELFTVSGERIPWADEEHLVDAQAFYEKARDVIAMVKT